MCSALAPQPAPKAHTPDAIGGNKGQMCDLDAKRVSWHVCQGLNATNPHYVNPSVNPSQWWQPKPASISTDGAWAQMSGMSGKPLGADHIAHLHNPPCM